MGFLPSTSNIGQPDQQLVHDLWSLVKGERKGYVTFDTLKVCALNFIGVKTPEREGDGPGDEEDEQPEEGEDGDEPADKPSDEFAKLAYFQEGRFFLKRGLHQALFTHFKNFYVHRMQFVGGV